MTEETQAGTEVPGEDTAAVLSHAAGERTYLEPKAEETPLEQDDTSGDDAAAETEAEAPAEPAPKKPTVQDRIDELTRARRDAERRAADLERRLAEATQPRQPQAEPQAGDVEPNPEQFQYGQADPEFIRALARYEAKQAFRAEAERQTRETQVRTIEQSWEQRQADFAKDAADYFDVIDRDWVCTQVMADAIKTSDEGARVAYHLAQNPDEARRIAALNPLAQVRELGRLEAKLSVPPPAAEPAPQPKTVSDAPAPHPQSRGLKGQFKPAADTTDFAAFERAYVTRGG